MPKKIVKKSKWFESKGESEFTAGGMYCDDEIQEVFSKGVIYDEFNLVRDSIFKKKSFYFDRFYTTKHMS